MRIRRALISVSDKTGIVELAQFLVDKHITLLSTGGSARLLQQQGIPVTEVADYTGFPEMMDGRVKTLHPKIHGGLLGRRVEDGAVMQQHGIEPIDLLVVNLYPFAQTISNPHCTLEQAIEQIDIGGPAMLRSAAKNQDAVVVLTDPNDYRLFMEHYAKEGNCSLDRRRAYAAKVFAHTAVYDATIAHYLQQQISAADKFPDFFISITEKVHDLRYGENPHQQAALYRDINVHAPSLVNATQHQGKKLSFNNLVDADSAWACVQQFSATTCVIVKHANPCGVASGASLLESYQRAYATDPTSAFGGIIAFNQEVDAITAKAIIEQQFVELIIAPTFTGDALGLLANKPAVRALSLLAPPSASTDFTFKHIKGGLVVQEDDTLNDVVSWHCVTTHAPSDSQLADLRFAWWVAKFVKSNAVVYAKHEQTLGIGAGQTSRVSSAELGILKAQAAGLIIADSVLASDAFFPFRDGVDAAAAAGVSAIVQPGGSIRDAEIIAAANEHNIAMIFTKVRHFRH